MDYRELDQAEYNRKLRMVIVGSEGLHAHVQDVGDNRATIGWGYTFNRDNNAAIWTDSGIDLTREQWRTLAAIDAAPAADRTRMGLTFTRELNEAESDQLLRASLTEYDRDGPAGRLEMPLSDERIALVSLAYNRGVGMLNGIPRSNVPEHAVMDAIRDGDRAEAWFQMRYNCWGSNNEVEGGLRKRRFAEAQVFGLYDDPDNITPDEAKSVYRMYQLHRDDIDRVERDFGVTVDGEASGRNRIAQANRDYPALVSEYGNVPNIADALAPARTALLRELRQDHPDLADRLTDANFDAGRIHLDSGRGLRDQDEVNLQYPTDTGSTRTNDRNTALRREQHNTTTEEVDQNHATTIDSQRMTRGQNPQEIDSNDLLIGEGGDDTLRAHRGDDILIGGEGRDRMEGGHGRDTYVVGEGDTVLDSDGMGEVCWGGHRLTGGTRSESDPANTYRSADDRFTYTVNGDDLTVTDNRATDPAQREGVVIESFQSGHLGITLTGPNRGGVQPQADQPGPDEQGRQRGIEDDRQGMNQPQPGPFNDPFADRYFAAVVAGDSDLADRIAIEFSQTPEGQQLAQLGDQLLAQQQALEQQQLEERQRAQQGPVMQM
jgi:GH24 family phage-related lysozyme (muramidase)